MRYLEGRSVRISIHAPRTGSDAVEMSSIVSDKISIHAPRTGSDAVTVSDKSPSPLFQSTLPARGATHQRC